MLHEVHTQHALKNNGGATALAFGVVGLYHRAQLCLRHNVVHGLEEGVALGGSAVLLESRALIGRHGQCFLFHPDITHDTIRVMTFFSFALIPHPHMAPGLKQSIAVGRPFCDPQGWIQVATLPDCRDLQVYPVFVAKT
jgi:hypothetical protein